MMKACVSMSHLVRMNLKQLYQRRSLWFVYAMLFLILPLSVRGFLGPELGKGLYARPSLAFFVVGVLVGTVFSESWARPMVFCLPRHQQASLRALMTVSLLLTGMSLLALIPLPTEYPVFLPTFVLSFVSLNLFCFWLGAGAVGVLGQWKGFFVFVFFSPYKYFGIHPNGLPDVFGPYR